MASTGRPPLLDETTKEEILAIVAVGGSARLAARFVGCNEGAIRHAAERDPEFGQRLRRARSVAEFGLVRNVRNASKQSWHAGAWLLERVFPERYGRRNADVITAQQFGDFVEQLIDIVEHEVPAALREPLIRHFRALVSRLLLGEVSRVLDAKVDCLPVLADPSLADKLPDGAEPPLATIPPEKWLPDNTGRLLDGPPPAEKLHFAEKEQADESL